MNDADRKLVEEAELKRLLALSPGNWFTADDDGPYSGKLVRVWGDGSQHWAEGFEIVTEEPEADDHPEQRALLVAAVNAAPHLLARLERMETALREIRAEVAGALDGAPDAGAMSRQANRVDRLAADALGEE